MKPSDQFHVGIVVDDMAAAAAELSEVFGHQWCEEIEVPATVRLPGGDTVLDLKSVYSMSTPRVELVQSIPGTLWQPADSGVHHLGYWSDDVAADSVELARRGHTVEAVGTRPDGTPYWAFHRGATGPRIELVTRTLQPALERFWATGRRNG
ncbi:VOC family protein [Streptomyces fulvoviolaceus]|uniref:VOC family protein n=1 Tax=Streptomyces fulvoviolaceus TaxID=285535 RepID=UPI0004C49629|nr:VOC family protein [Streptomyces fulvoviolaceus]MCT9079627.1 VOC family protein [Streptomyces fulvoviolaceus]